MEQKRRIKSLLPVRIDWRSWFLTTLLLSLSVVMCVMSLSLMISRAEAAPRITGDFGGVAVRTGVTSVITGNVHFRVLDDLVYDGAIDNEVEVVYAMRFLDPGDFTRFVNNIYMSGKALYVTPNPVIVHSDSFMETPSSSPAEMDNTVGTAVYGHVLGGGNNKVYSNNVTLIAGRDNEVVSGNDNAAVLGGVGNKFGPGKDGGNPMVVIGGSGNIMGMGHDGNALIGGENNTIGDNTSNVFILGGKNNVVSSGVKNVIVGGKNVVVSGISNIFAFSNFDDNFYPLSPNAFYLNLLKGVGIGMDRDYPGLSVNGAISLGEIDITHVACSGDSRGVLGSYNGCLVGCFANDIVYNEQDGRLHLTDGKWTLLDVGNKCVEMCELHDNRCTRLFLSGVYEGVCGDQGGGGALGRAGQQMQGIQRGNIINNLVVGGGGVRVRTGTNGVVYPFINFGDSPYGHCTKGDFIDVVNAHNCDGSGAETLYSSSVMFETSLINPEDDCPRGENKCVYQCNSGNHLAKISGTYKCQRDCQMNWADTGSQAFRAGQKTVGFKKRVVDCINSGGVNVNTCDDYMEILVCQNGTMRIDGTSYGAVQQGYVYSDCEMGTFTCNLSDYNITSNGISTIYGDTIDTSDLSGKTEVVGTRGTYGVCMDYQGGGEGLCEVSGLHFKLKFCNSGYTLVDGKCMKDCTWKENGDTKHGIGRMFYTTGSVACSGACSGQLFTCNDGNWSGANKAEYTYTSCNHTPRICDESYNVTFAGYQLWSGNGQYESCENIEVIDNVCTGNNSVYKLVGCNAGLHTVDGRTCSERNTMTGACSGNPQNSEWINGGTYTKTWSGTWNTGEWISNSGTDCQWVCESGYHEDDGVCISNEMMACVAPAGWNTGTWEWEKPTYTWNGGSYPRPTYVGNADDDSECVYECSGSGYTGFVYNVYDDAKGCVSCFDYCSQGTYRVRDVFYYHSGRCYENIGGKEPNLDGSCGSGFDLDNERSWCYPECSTL